LQKWLHGANNQQEQSKATLTVLYDIHTTAKPTQQPNPISTSKKQSMGVCKGAFPLPILQKQHRPYALQTINCTLADYQLQKSVEQTTDRNRARLPSLFGMKFTQVPSQYSSQPGPICRANNVAQQFSYLMVDNGTERWRGAVLDNLWRSHIDSIAKIN
jgi:hypothetical protein